MGNAGRWDGLGGEVGGNNEGEHVSSWHLLQKPDTMRSPPEEHSAKTTRGETPLMALSGACSPYTPQAPSAP